jgi:tetratricopeptide (TPR) repeat protein
MTLKARISRRTTLIMLALVGVTLLIYAQSLYNSFVGYDDPEYVTRNERVQAGLSAENVTWAFRTLYFSNWHPLTWLAHMGACEAFDLNAGGHHAIDLTLHIANALLLFLALRYMTNAPWPSALVAALFAWHPLHVESVAWVSARKDTLSTFFMMLTILAYARYARGGSGGRIGWYAGMLACYALALMAKSMVVTLPAVLLLFDYWPVARWRGAVGERRRLIRLVAEKLPLVAMAVATIAVNFVAQKGASALTEHTTLAQRLANATWAYGAYLGKVVWPVKLAPFYPHPIVVGQGVWGARFIVTAVVLLVITVFVVRSARSRPYLIVGWLIYLGTLIPVIGIVQLGAQSMADRYTYVPLIGIFIAIAWLANDAVARHPRWRRPIAVTAGGGLLTLAAVTTIQVSYWRDTLTLFTHATEVTQRNFIAEFYIGNELFKMGDMRGATSHFAKAVTANPNYLEAHLNLGAALEVLGDRTGAERHYRIALDLKPDDPDAKSNLDALLAAPPSPRVAPSSGPSEP